MNHINQSETVLQMTNFRNLWMNYSINCTLHIFLSIQHPFPQAQWKPLWPKPKTQPRINYFLHLLIAIIFENGTKIRNSCYFPLKTSSSLTNAGNFNLSSIYFQFNIRISITWTITTFSGRTSISSSARILYFQNQTNRKKQTNEASNLVGWEGEETLTLAEMVGTERTWSSEMTT